MKTISTLILALAFSVPSLALTVGKVNAQKVLTTINEGKRVGEKLKKKVEEKQKILKKEEDKFKKMQEDFQKQTLVMNDKAKAKKQAELQQAYMKLQQTMGSFQNEIRDMEAKLQAPIVEKIKKVVEKVSKDSGVDITVESRTSPILFAKKEKDLTEDVIKAYNKEHK
ncbi:OmpH family outer membrane protein [Halobacteriovorax sp. GB3]|uniref:OmpH family outer membrane protein n=1 Tax=Halobacteriovorax sp. GB3 TaxID=2719615 RepID=UPI00235F4066|nr:OmpH family outer membrane protein [Halobacteriovorax sp. GB3]MDD0854098.1 OmpH family outer membrane protein [Halobacteriovorax sp. GB3]